MLFEDGTVMSNHFDGGCNIRSRGVLPCVPARRVIQSPSVGIGVIVRGFKSAVTKRINELRANPGCPVWRRNYYERIIRNEKEPDETRTYIVNNPIKWALDEAHPEISNNKTGDVNDH